MKIYGNLLALCVVYPNVSAFAPKQLRQSAKAVTPVSPSFSSYLGNLGSETTNGVGGRQPSPAIARASGPTDNRAQKIWEKTPPVKVQGGSLKTWTYASPTVESVQVVLKTEGRPLETDIDLWQGPDNTPTKMRVYIEDGAARPFSAIIETPRGPNTIAIRNTAHLEFPLDACVVATDPNSPPDPLAVSKSADRSTGRTIQGGALRTYPFDANVQSVQVLLKTDGRPLNARIELLQGPNNKKQVIDLYTEDGMDRPFFAVIEAPGSGNVVRVVNTATVEFPMTAWVEPYFVGSDESLMEPVLGGDSSAGFMLDRQWDRQW